MKSFTWGAMAALLVATGVQNESRALEIVNPPILEPLVANGTLPPASERVPEHPRVMDFSAPGLRIGRHGGRIESLIRKEKDVKLLTVYGYARLVGFDSEFRLVADILESYEVEDGRVFTFRLRKGHRWSDGQPFTAEDFRFWWEDVATNEKLRPAGPPSTMLVDGKPPRFSVLDAETVRYEWDAPNPDFLARLAGASPLYIYAPAHYLKQFHEAYADPDVLPRKVEAAGYRTWAELFDAVDNLYFANDPDLPSLQPWVNGTRPPNTRFVARRNPYYHRVDPEGRQLPYADELILTVTAGGLIPVKTGAGESNLQSRGLSLKDYVFLREAEERSGYRTYLWTSALGSEVALFFNFNVSDPVWANVIRDVRFRRAMSLAVNRHEINQVLYFGLAKEGADTVSADSPLYRPELASAWSGFDPGQAEQLLDAAGLTRGADGLRRLPDGRPLTVIAETAGEQGAQVDTLLLVKDSWERIGVKLIIKPMQRELLRKRIASGESVLAVWTGLPNAVATRETSPKDLVPYSQYDFQWPSWGAYYESGGHMGTEPDLPEVRRLAELYKLWRAAGSDAARRAAWDEILSIRADQVYSIGTVSASGQPVVVGDGLVNVPKQAVYNWHPGAFFGVYAPDIFWFDR
ncbi:ABC transporter substrate-binding protein [Nisaea acidiphila]|uniref:ABC transporter substrate-binding protein n=1 Tax=Nisaea acidiphila TaxID=1862145 RepID=A0A9J7ANP8_9PROT|nr:ABC transporter substrate-binding protein [Nisaea acidiphila]UUX48562.1 ABC transporter substrate-binding protein [Nisaea acidiphila]